MRIFAVIFFILVASTVSGQNLITNSSFEDTISCATIPGIYYGLIETTPPWKSYVQSSDFASENYCGLPLLPYGIQYAHSGDSFAGSGVYDSIFVFPGLREIFGQELTTNLISGHIYCVTFYVSLAGGSSFGIDKIGAFFSSYEIDPIDLFSFNLIPQIQNPSGNVILDTINWTQISGTFVANGTEKFISIGNFFEDGDFQITHVPWVGQFPHSYYFFDDISVIDCTVGVEELEGIEIEVYPNPTKDILIVKSDNILNQELIIYNILSEVVYSNRFDEEIIIDTRTFRNGVYFLKVESKSGKLLHTQKFVKL